MAVGAAVATPGGSLSQPARNKTARGIVSFWKPSRGLARRTGKPAGTQASAGTLNQEGYFAHRESTDANRHRIRRATRCVRNRMNSCRTPLRGRCS